MARSMHSYNPVFLLPYPSRSTTAYGISAGGAGIEAQEKFESALVIIAHADDAEFGSAGTIAKWVKQGVEVTYVVVTNGNKGSADPDMTPEALAALREKEQRAACKVLGVKNVVFLGYHDGELVPSLELRRDLTREVRRYKPDVAMVPDPTTWYFGNVYINHPDHRAVGEAALAAIFPSARDRLTFPEAAGGGLRASQSPGGLPVLQHERGHMGGHYGHHGDQAGGPEGAQVPAPGLGRDRHQRARAGYRYGRGARNEVRGGLQEDSSAVGCLSPLSLPAAADRRGTPCTARSGERRRPERVGAPGSNQRTGRGPPAAGGPPAARRP